MAPEAAVLACPGLKNGNVHVELYDKGQTSIIPAHNNPLSQLALNSDGSLLVTCSDKGTLVRVFDTESGTQIKEFRRGATKAEIYSLAFNANSTAVVVSSERGTIHIYGLPPRTSEQSAEEAKSNKSSKYPPHNLTHSFSFMRDILPSYFGSEWSYAQFQIPSPCICCFGQSKSNVICVCADGTFYSYAVGAKGECAQEVFSKFLDPN